MNSNLLADQKKRSKKTKKKNMYFLKNFKRILLMLDSVYTDSTKIDQIFLNKVKCHVVFIAKYVFSIAAMEIISSKKYFTLLYELFKIEVPKITQKWDWTKYFPYNSSLLIKSQI